MTNQHWHESQQRSPQPYSNGHSNEVERRLTQLEYSTSTLSEYSSATRKRLKWIERALQVLAAVVYLLATGKLHESIPAFAEMLIKLLLMK